MTGTARGVVPVIRAGVGQEGYIIALRISCIAANM